MTIEAIFFDAAGTLIKPARRVGETYAVVTIVGWQYVAADPHKFIWVFPAALAILLAQRVQQEFPQGVFFTSKLIFDEENWLTQLLHNQAALAIQRRLHLQGQPMIILPLKL